MGSKQKALFALAVFMIGMLSAGDAEAGLFRNRRSVFGRIRERIAERRERRFERRFERRERRERFAGVTQKPKPQAQAQPQPQQQAQNPNAGAGGNGQAQVANQQIKPASPLDTCNVRLVRCTEQENAETNEKTPFCQVRSTPAGSPEEVLRVTKAGTLVVMRDDGLAATTPEMIRFLGAEYQAIAAQQAQTGGGVNPLIVAFNNKNAPLLNSPLQACIGGIYGNSLAFNQPGFTPNNPAANLGGVPLAPADGPVQPMLTPPNSPQANNPGALRQQDLGGGDDVFGDPAGLGTVQLRTGLSRGVASTQSDAHSGGQATTQAVRRKKRPVAEDLVQNQPAKTNTLGAPTLLGSPFQNRSVIQ